MDWIKGHGIIAKLPKPNIQIHSRRYPQWTLLNAMGGELVEKNGGFWLHNWDDWWSQR